MVLGGAVGEAVLPRGVAGDPTFETRRICAELGMPALQPGGLRCGLDAPQQVPMTPPFPSLV